jgi:membrane associated rhomboid family serine protease
MVTMAAPIITNLLQNYRRGSMPVRFIYLNVGLFLLCALVGLLLRLFHVESAPLLHQLMLPADPLQLLCQPWSVVTYMFLQVEPLHLLFNMLWLYWFGQLFLYFFSERAFGGLYLFGGLCGAVLYLLCFNLLPLFTPSGSYLLGASASVLAITMATAVREPNFKIRLFLFGELSLKYVAGLMVVMDLLLITSENAGGHIAHLGGALGGLWYALMLRRGVDITAWINRLLDALSIASRRFSHPLRRERRPKMKVHRGGNSRGGRSESKTSGEEMNRILDKLKQSGYNSLTTDEKKQLFDASKR